MLKVKKETIVKSLFTTILAVGFASNVSATQTHIETDTSHRITGGICNYPLIDEGLIKNGHCSTDGFNDKMYRLGGGEIFKFDGKKGYCVDPGKKAPESENYEVKDVTSQYSEYIKGFSDVCKKTIGNDALRITALHVYGVSSGFSNSTDLADGYNHFIKNGGKGRVRLNPDVKGYENLLSFAKASTTEEKSTVEFNDSKDGFTLKTSVSGVIKFTNSSTYKIKVNGIQLTGNEYKVEVSDKKVHEYKITVDKEGCTDGTVKAAFNYKEDDLVESSSSEAKIYSIKTKGTNNLQRILVCEDTSSSQCKDKNCSIEKEYTVTCTSEPVCDPSVVVNNGDEYCDPTGKTIVSVSEVKDTATEKACSKKVGTNATEKLLGKKNDYCSIYCIESFDLTLPGPTAGLKGEDGNSKDVKITSGTFFTIDESNMVGKSTVKCFNIIDTDKLNSKVNAVRSLSVDMFNQTEKNKAYKNATCESNGEGYSLKVGSYKRATLNSDGTIKIETVPASTDGSGSTQNACEKIKNNNIVDITDTHSQSNYETSIKNMISEYNECVNWNEFNDKFIKSFECPVDIEFNYHSGMENVFKPTIEVENTTVVENKVDTSSTGKRNIYTGICNDSTCSNNTTSVTTGTAVGTLTIDTKYTFNNYFVSNLETGELKQVEKNSGHEDNWSEVTKGFPVDIRVPQGKYEYKYTYSGIGHDFTSDKCQTGRLDKLLKDRNLDSKLECVYEVNSCRDCEPICADCEIDQDECDDACRFACVGVGCIMSGNSGFLATYRTLSLNDPSLLTLRAGVTPATLLAYNNSPSSTDDYNRVTEGKKTNWSTDKGKMAAGKITNDGEKIYDKKPEYSVTINAKSKKTIKDYNKTQKNYLSSELNCKLVEGSYGICESTLLDDLAKSNNASINGRNYGNEKDPYGNVRYPGTQDSFVGPAYK